MRGNRTNFLYLLVIASVLPFLWLFTQQEIAGSGLATLAGVMGLVGSVILWWQVLLGFRFLFKKIFPDFISITNLHINLGIYGSILVLIHPILEIMVLEHSFSFLIKPDFSSTVSTHITFGKIALFLFVITWVLSAVLRKKISFRAWKYLHFLSYPLVAFVFLHAYKIGIFLNAIPGLKYYWYFFPITFILIVALKILEVFNFGKAKYTLKQKEMLGNDIVLYTLAPKENKFISPKVGQFAYIKAHFFGESHPFSVVKFDQASGQLTFGIKASGPFTKKLKDLALESQVYIDGPYGVFTKEGHNELPKVVIAGGVGITPFVQLVEKYGNEKTFMFYANKNLDGAIFRDEFKEKLDGRYKDVIADEVSLINDDGVIKGRLSREVLENVLPKDMLTEARYFICGPKGFMNAISESLVSLGVRRESIFTEEFSL